MGCVCGAVEGGIAGVPASGRARKHSTVPTYPRDGRAATAGAHAHGHWHWCGSACGFEKRATGSDGAGFGADLRSSARDGDSCSDNRAPSGDAESGRLAAVVGQVAVQSGIRVISRACMALYGPVSRREHDGSVLAAAESTSEAAQKASVCAWLDRPALTVPMPRALDSPCHHPMPARASPLGLLKPCGLTPSLTLLRTPLRLITTSSTLPNAPTWTAPSPRLHRAALHAPLLPPALPRRASPRCFATGASVPSGCSPMLLVAPALQRAVMCARRGSR
jgi:hypothetical protein